MNYLKHIAIVQESLISHFGIIKFPWPPSQFIKKARKTKTSIFRLPYFWALTPFLGHIINSACISYLEGASLFMSQYFHARGGLLRRWILHNHCLPLRMVLSCFRDACFIAWKLAVWVHACMPCLRRKRIAFWVFVDLYWQGNALLSQFIRVARICDISSCLKSPE